MALFHAAHNTGTEAGRVLAEAARHGMRLAPWVRRHSMQLPSLSQGVRVGWAQLPQSQGAGFSLGVFADGQHFTPMAFADKHGNVFLTDQPTVDAHAQQPCFAFGLSELDMMSGAGAGMAGRHERSNKHANTSQGHDGRDTHDTHDSRAWYSWARQRAAAPWEALSAWAGEQVTGRARRNQPQRVARGGIIGRNDAGEMMWLAAWSARNDVYTLSQLRCQMPKSLTHALSYRDAMAVGFFAAWLVPTLQGNLMSFGSGNIFRRLNQEAPMSAIRHAIDDVRAARQQGLRVSGLEAYFVTLLDEVTNDAAQLGATHGAEPLRLSIAEGSGNYVLAWQEQLPYALISQALQVEARLNRFAAVSAWLERNDHLMLQPTEESATLQDCARIDDMLLRNPLLLALTQHDEQHPARFAASEHAQASRAQGAQGSQSAQRGHHDLHAASLKEVLERKLDAVFAKRLANAVAAQQRTQAGASQSQASHAQRRSALPTVPPAVLARVHEQSAQEAARHATVVMDAARAFMRQFALQHRAPGEAMQENATHSEPWVYRQVLAHLVRSLRLPYRFDAEIRCNVEQGQVAIAFTAASMSLMPTMRYDAQAGGMVPLSQEERAQLHMRYNAQLAIMLAALAAGIDERMQLVAVRCDSLGLDEFVATQSAYNEQVLRRQLQLLQDAQEVARQLTPSRSQETPDAHAVRDDNSANSDNSDDEEHILEEHAQEDSQAQASAFNDSNDSDASPTDNAVSAELNAISQAHEHADANTDNAHDADNTDTDSASAGEPSVEAPTEPVTKPLLCLQVSPQACRQHLSEQNFDDPLAIVRSFGAVMHMTRRGFMPIQPTFDVHDVQFSPLGAQEEPEFSTEVFTASVAQALGTQQARGLSIQREDVLQQALNQFQEMLLDEQMPASTRAHMASAIMQGINDPELNEHAQAIIKAMIDGDALPPIVFHYGADLRADSMQEPLQEGALTLANEQPEELIRRYDERYQRAGGVPRYFNSYAERVVYNHLFKQPHEHTILIPDELFYAHMRAADSLAQRMMSEPSEEDGALKHLNAMVAYAPAYPVAHMRLAMYVSGEHEWDLAIAACLNALQVALDREDAAFAYSRLGYALWMQDQFIVAAAAYALSAHIAADGALSAASNSEFAELRSRMQSQGMPVPDGVKTAQRILRAQRIPVWPHTRAARIVRQAARVSVNEHLFVPARSLASAAIRLHGGQAQGVSMAQVQFLRSLNA